MGSLTCNVSGCLVTDSQMTDNMVNDLKWNLFMDQIFPEPLQTHYSRFFPAGFTNRALRLTWLSHCLCNFCGQNHEVHPPDLDQQVLELLCYSSVFYLDQVDQRLLELGPAAGGCCCLCSCPGGGRGLGGHSGDRCDRCGCGCRCCCCCCSCLVERLLEGAGGEEHRDLRARNSKSRTQGDGLTTEEQRTRVKLRSQHLTGGETCIPADIVALLWCLQTELTDMGVIWWGGWEKTPLSLLSGSSGFPAGSWKL